MEKFKVVCPECSHVNTINIENEQGSYPCTSCQAELGDPFPVDLNDERCLTHISHDDMPVLVDFYSNVCGPCVAMFEDYEDAALQFPLKVRFLKIDADVHQEVARKSGVGALPTIIAFHKGQEVNRISRQLSQVELTLWAESLLQ
jgi:thioredoxin 2